MNFEKYFQVDFRGKHEGLSVNFPQYSVDFYYQIHLAKSEVVPFKRYSYLIKAALRQEHLNIIFSYGILREIGSMKVGCFYKFLLIEEFDPKHNCNNYTIIPTSIEYPEIEVKGNYFTIKNEEYPLISERPLYYYRQAVGLAQQVIDMKIKIDVLLEHIGRFSPNQTEQIDLKNLDYGSSRALVESITNKLYVLKEFWL